MPAWAEYVFPSPTDLVGKLREAALGCRIEWGVRLPEQTTDSELLDLAADEIERLKGGSAPELPMPVQRFDI